MKSHDSAHQVEERKLKQTNKKVKEKKRERQERKKKEKEKEEKRKQSYLRIYFMSQKNTKTLFYISSSSVEKTF